MTHQLVVVIAILGGCAAPLSSFQAAHVQRKGHVTAESGIDVSVPVGTIVKLLDAAETLARDADDRSLTSEERQQVIEAGASLVLVPPGPVSHVGVTYAPLDRFEVGIRTAGGGWRVAARYQVLRQESDRIDLTLGLGLGRFAYEYPVDDVLGILELEKFKRYTIELPIAIGQRGSWYRWWGGPRVIYNKFSTALRLTQPPIGMAEQELVLASVDGSGAFVGGQLGAAVGYKHLFVAFELTMAKLISNAHLQAGSDEADVDLGGFVIYPGLAVMGEL